jgi:hypothetical protein
VETLKKQKSSQKGGNYLKNDQQRRFVEYKLKKEAHLLLIRPRSLKKYLSDT